MCLCIGQLQLDSILAHAQRDYPGECCGAMLGTLNGDDRVVVEVKELANIHEEGTARRFRINPQQLLWLERHARAVHRQIVGFYHSHPDCPARPSDCDRENALPIYSYVIVSVKKGRPCQVTSWIFEDAPRDFIEEPVIVADRRAAEDPVSLVCSVFPNEPVG